MTYIELFDEDALENICSCFACVPDRVILIGDLKKQLDEHTKCYEEILRDRGYSVEFIPQTVDKHSIESIINVLASIVERYEDCVFDLTGGGDLYLAAVGIISQKYKEKNIKLQRYNPYTGWLYDFDENYAEIRASVPISVSCEENIKLYGGRIIKETANEQDRIRWDLTEDFVLDINNMWDICCEDFGKWNLQAVVFAYANKNLASSEASLEVYIDTKKIKSKLNKSYFPNRRLLNKLYQKGLLSSLRYDKNGFFVKYKNKQVKACLAKAGQILELKIYNEALNIKDDYGSPIYNDAKTGVCIEWDDEKCRSSTNEIDVMLMHAAVPVFVSCKNGGLDANELYKLEVVAEKFGGKYSKKVLIAPKLEENSPIVTRATDMGIRLITEISNDNDALKRVVASLWKM